MKKVISMTLSIIMIAIIFVGCSQKNAIKIEMDINGTVTTKEFKTDKTTLEDLLVEKATDLGATLTDSEYGKFVAGINNYTPDAAKNEFIEVIVNGESSMVGIKEIPITNDDVYTFKISTFE